MKKRETEKARRCVLLTLLSLRLRGSIALPLWGACRACSCRPWTHDLQSRSACPGIGRRRAPIPHRLAGPTVQRLPLRPRIAKKPSSECRTKWHTSSPSGMQRHASRKLVAWRPSSQGCSRPWLTRAQHTKGSARKRPSARLPSLHSWRKRNEMRATAIHERRLSSERERRSPTGEPDRRIGWPKEPRRSNGEPLTLYMLWKRK